MLPGSKLAGRSTKKTTSFLIEITKKREDTKGGERKKKGVSEFRERTPIRQERSRAKSGVNVPEHDDRVKQGRNQQNELRKLAKEKGLQQPGVTTRP